MNQPASLAALAALVLAFVLGTVGSAQAAEPRPSASAAAGTTAWSEPNAALGVPLAVYLARHQARVLLLPGV